MYIHHYTSHLTVQGRRRHQIKVYVEITRGPKQYAGSDKRTLGMGGWFVLLIKSLGRKPRSKNKTKTEGPEKNHGNLFENDPHHCPRLRFTPDFTASRVIRELKLVTSSGSEFVFVLNASLPYHMLAACAEALPRPNWELALYIIISGVMRYSVFLQGWFSLRAHSASHFSQG